MTTSAPFWRIARAPRRRASDILTLDQPRIVAILNATPDSFSDGGAYPTVDAAVAWADRAAMEGAVMLDIGGESTRPGAVGVDAAEQIRRTAPVIAAIRRGPGPAANIPISIDTTLAEVARAALDAGADVVNDQSAGRDDAAMLPLIAERGPGVVLMHRLRPPRTDSYSTHHPVAPDYGAAGVVSTVRAFLDERAQAALAAGIDAASIVLDPGLGFGKNVEQNRRLVDAAPELLSLGYPLLCAASRKSFLGGTDPRTRVRASVELAVAQFHLGVRLFRVHDVAEHRRALTAAQTGTRR